MGPSPLPSTRTALGLELREVTKQYPGARTAAIAGLSLEVGAGEVCVLVGPSGSGKTTAMRLINRLIPLTSGDILLGGESVLDCSAVELRREIGYVIQQVGLFPHLTVAENIATVPRLLGWDGPNRRPHRELLELSGSTAEEIGRYPAALSGGQRQRVGVARALAADPPLILMDEPFGAIDPITRARLQDEFLATPGTSVRKTVVFVTHDIDEAIKMGDRVAVMRAGGTLAQYATPDELLRAPADEFVAQFVGADRALKRLALATLADIELEDASGLNGDHTRLPDSTTLRDALALLLTGDGRPVLVVDAAQKVLGTLLDLEGAERAATARARRALITAAATPVIPNFGASASNCARRNPLFCFDWVSRNWDGVLWPALREHIVLTVIAVAIGFAISTALALAAYRLRWIERPVVVVTLVLYTIPSIALFELLVGVPGLGLSVTSAEVALVSYTLLILFRNILTGLRDVPEEVRDTARGMG